MKREFTGAAAWSGAASWVEQIAGALVFVTIARIIGVESFGIVAMAFAFLFVGEVLVRDTLAEAIIERETLEEGRLEATFLALLGFSGALSLVLFFSAPLVAQLYREPFVAPLLAVSSPVVFLIGLGSVSTALLRRRMEYRLLSIRSIVGLLSGGVVGIVMAFYGFGVWSLVAQRFVEIGLNTALAIVSARWWPRRLPTRHELALVRGLGPRVLELRFWTLIVAQTPTVALGIFADPRAAGLFAFAARLVEIVLKLSVRAIQFVAQSAIAELRRQTGATSRFFIDLTELSAFSGFVSFAGLALISDPLARVLLGPSWEDAANILPFLCLAGAVMALTATQEAYLLALDRLDVYLGRIRLEALIGVVLIGIAGPSGAVAVAAAVAIRALLLLPLCTKAALQPEAVAPGAFLAALRAPAIVAVAMASILLVWRFAALDRVADVAYLALAICIGAGTVVILVALFMPSARARLSSYVRG